jgi:hypothetical protein
VVVGSAKAGDDIALSGAKLMLARAEAGRDILLDATGDIVVGTARSGDDFVADAGGAFTGTDVATTGTGPDGETEQASIGLRALASGDGSNIRVSATGPVRLDTGAAANILQLSSRESSVASAQSLTAGGSLLAESATAMTLGNVTAAQAIDLEAGGAIGGTALAAGTTIVATSGDAITLVSATAGGNLDLSGTNGVTAQRLASGGRATLRAPSGAVLVSQDLRSAQAVDASGRSVALNAVGGLSVRNATATAGNVALTSGGDLAIQTVDASGVAGASAGGLLAVNGAVNGTQISLSSRDIAIGQTAQVGTAGRTNAVQITANGGAQPIIIGGSGQGDGYRLDNAEFSRIAAQNVTVSGQGENASMRIDTLTVRGAGSASGFNVRDTLTLSSSGSVEMIGRLSVENGGEGNMVRVNAGRDFFADIAGAGISVTNAAGALTGRVEIQARDVIIASRSAQADLAGISDIEGRSDRLSRNEGSTDVAGFIRAGAIRLAARDRILVQNSGVSDTRRPDERAGVTAGAGGLTLAALGTTPVEVIINGRQADASGSFILGRDLIQPSRPKGHRARTSVRVRLDREWLPGHGGAVRRLLSARATTRSMGPRRRSRSWKSVSRRNRKTISPGRRQSGSAA